MKTTLRWMSFKRAFVLIALVLPAALCLPDPGPEEAAESAALTWLGALDAGDYPTTWKTASSYFKEHISAANWAAAAASARGSVRALQSRRLTSATLMHTMPGAPDGDYVIIVFKTSFAGKAEAIETVTPMKDVDGTWHVSGYYIK
jgi:Protein of unknown function (DUF4019)